MKKNPLMSKTSTLQLYKMDVEEPKAITVPCTNDSVSTLEMNPTQQYRVVQKEDETKALRR